MEERMKTREFFGKEVLDADANRVGKVADIDVDLLQGVINHMVVKSGLTRKYVIGLDKIEKIGDKVILRVKADELK
jgi:sporulation protein YlmC with PRC-barrel domain